MNAPEMPVMFAVAAATVALCVLFALVYWIARRIDNFGYVDVAWSYAFALVAVFYAALLPGWELRRWLIALLVVAWSARLGTHLFRRVTSHHPREDGRYRKLREDWAGNFAPKMFGFFQMQALSVVLLSVPFLLISRNPAGRFHWLEIAGGILWLAAIAGESLADAQLRRFQRDPANAGRVCNTGLWRYSRHPNYFFEWLIWVSFSMIALAAPWGVLALLSPGIILYLLLNVTGIPLAEQQSLKSRGDAFRRYQQTTSAFIPLPPRKAAR